MFYEQGLYNDVLMFASMWFAGGHRKKVENKSIYQKDLKNINDSQKLLGDINLIYTSLEIPNSDLTNLFSP